MNRHHMGSHIRFALGVLLAVGETVSRCLSATYAWPLVRHSGSVRFQRSIAYPRVSGEARGKRPHKGATFGPSPRVRGSRLFGADYYAAATTTEED